MISILEYIKKTKTTDYGQPVITPDMNTKEISDVLDNLGFHRFATTSDISRNELARDVADNGFNIYYISRITTNIHIALKVDKTIEVYTLYMRKDIILGVSTSVYCYTKDPIKDTFYNQSHIKDALEQINTNLSKC